MFGFPSWAVLAVVAVLSASSSAWVTREVYTGKIAKIELAQADALIKAQKFGQVLQRGLDQVAISSAATQGIAQEKILIQTVTLTKEIPIYVPDNSTCITVGLVRVLDAAAAGADPAALDLAAGESNETCAGFGWHALAESITGNYGRARQDAAQLTGLQEYVREIQSELAKPPTS